MSIGRANTSNLQGNSKIRSFSKLINRFNEASGGAVTTVTNYNGTGETWNVHTFNSSGNFVVTNSIQPFRIFLLAGGGPHGSSSGPNGINGGGGGGGGGALRYDSQSLTNQTYTINIGALSTNTTGFGYTALAGGRGGDGGANGANGGCGGGGGSCGKGRDGGCGVGSNGGIGSQGGNGGAGIEGEVDT
jgi:hypothetical protein